MNKITTITEISKTDDELQTKINLFGCKLANQRKELKLSQQDIALSVGTTQNIQSKFERGLTSPRVEYLYKLENLGFDIQNLIFSKTNEDVYILNKFEKSLMDFFRNADYETQLQAIGLLATGNANQTVMNQKGGDFNQNNSVIITEKQVNKNIQSKKQ